MFPVRKKLIDLLAFGLESVFGPSGQVIGYTYLQLINGGHPTSLAL